MLWKLGFVFVLAVGVLAGTLKDDKDTFEVVFSVYCKTKHAEDKFEQLKAAKTTFVECVKKLVDVESFRMSLEAANGTKFDEILKSYCTKAPQLKVCVNNLLTSVNLCFPDSIASTSIKEANTFIDFACDNDGAKIVSFFNNDAFKCFEQQEEQLAKCAESVEADIIKQVGSEDLSVVFTLTEEQKCRVERSGVQCAASKLKSCPNPTPGNLVEELYKKFPCYVEKAENETVKQ